MKTVVVLSMLVLTLIGGATATAGEKAESKKVQECKTLCLDQKLNEPTCKAACTVSENFELVWTQALECSITCCEKNGKGTPATKACEAACKKKYEVFVKEVTGHCDAACTTEETEPIAVEKCRKICDPALIIKEMAGTKTKN